MKKITVTLIAAALILTLASCGGPVNNGVSGTGADGTATEPAQSIEESTAESATAEAQTAEESEYFKDGAVLFRAFLELSGEEFVSLVEAQGYEWYDNDYVLSGFAGEGASSGFQKSYLADYIQVCDSATDFRSYEDIKSAGKGDLSGMGVAFNVRGEYADGSESISFVFDGLDTVEIRKDPNDEKGSGAALIKDGSGKEYLAMYTTEFYTNGTATVSFIVRTDEYFAANPFGGTASSIDAVWSQLYVG